MLRIHIPTLIILLSFLPLIKPINHNDISFELKIEYIYFTVWLNFGGNGTLMSMAEIGNKPCKLIF